MAPCAPRAALVLLALTGLMALAACDEADPAADPDPPADEPADEAADDADEPDDAALEANLTDGCVEDAEPGDELFPEQAEIEHASNVSLTYEGTYKVLEVDAPGGGDPTPVVLLQCGAPEPDLDGDLAEASVIEVPVERAVTATTTNLPHFDLLDAVDALAGIGRADFVTTDAVREAAEEGELAEVAGPDDEPELETVVEADPDVLIMDGFGPAALEDVDRYRDAGIPVALNADFAEQDLLGRAEWIKVTGALLNAEAAATEAFDEIAAEVEALREQVDEVADDDRPTVLLNEPFEGTWFAPAGDSYQARAIDEAGGDYVFADADGTETLELDLETVLDEAADADVWLQAGSVMGTLDDLLAVDERLGELDAFEDEEVWAFDRGMSPGGGLPVFEEAYTRADLYLADLVSILQPEVLPDHERRFFGRVGADR